MAQKPHWPVDLSLTTHVFQFQDRYHEELIAERFAAAFDYAWGISEVEWDSRALSSGQVALRHLRAVMPDGTPVSLDAREASSCAPRSVRELPPGGSLIVSVGIPRVTTRSSTGEPGSRYVRERALAADYANGSDPVSLEWLRPNLGLYLEGERVDGVTTLACARVARAGAGVVAFDPTFVPPVLTVSASSYLDVELRRGLDALASRRISFRRAPARDANDGPRRWLVSLVSGFIPRLADIIEQHAHPHRAYLLLAEMVGALAAFTPEGDARIPPFNYDHLGPMFVDLFGSLHRVLDALGAERFRKLSLLASENSSLYAELKEPGIFAKEFYLAVAGDDVERLRQDVPRTFKVAAWADLQRVVSTHSTGVILRPEHVAPPSLPDAPGVVYFMLEKSEPFTPVYKTGELGIHHAGLAGVRDIALYVVDA